jgi:hypothetical protein
LDCRLVFGQAVVRKMKCGKCERESLTCSWVIEIWVKKIICLFRYPPLLIQWLM